MSMAEQQQQEQRLSNRSFCGVSRFWIISIIVLVSSRIREHGLVFCFSTSFYLTRVSRHCIYQRAQSALLTRGSSFYDDSPLQRSVHCHNVMDSYTFYNETLWSFVFNLQNRIVDKLDIIQGCGAIVAGLQHLFHNQ